MSAPRGRKVKPDEEDIVAERDVVSVRTVVSALAVTRMYRSTLVSCSVSLI